MPCIRNSHILRNRLTCNTSECYWLRLARLNRLDWTARREAGHLIGDLRSLPPGVKPLGAVLADYVELTEREVGRQALAAEHPALASILQASAPPSAR